MTTQAGPTAYAELNDLHDEMPTRPGHWTKHLEGSYPVASELRTLDDLGREWLYIDHGWREMQWSTHCNTEVARWSMRERGVTLHGPDPRDLIDPVPADALQDRMRQTIPTFMDDLATWVSIGEIAWGQRYAVSCLCRMLETLHDGEVHSKRAALLWASETLDPVWRPLLSQVLEDRQRGWDPNDHPRPGSVEQTRAFATEVVRLAAGR